MASKKTAIVRIALCITAILAIALCGCDDLGAYEDVEEYYASLGEDIILIDGTSRAVKEYSVKDYFYNEDAREDFLEGDDGAYKGVEHSDYVYMGIYFEKTIDVDTLALYLQSESDTTVYLNFYVADKIPEKWKSFADLEAENSGTEDSEGSGTEGTEGESGTETEEPTYDDPDSETRIGEVAVNLKAGKWNSFVLDSFTTGARTEKSIKINEGQYILIQIRNNSGVRIFDLDKQAFVDPQLGIELPKAEITMTNLMIRALSLNDETQSQEGET